MNKAIISGRLGKDPESRFTDNGSLVVTFSVATSIKTKEGEQTTWHNVVVWNKTAENCQKYLQKGSLVLVDGRIVHREFVGKDGIKKMRPEIVANTVEFLGSKPQGQQADTPHQVEQQYESSLEDIPF
jgi:single-strand DNA-binding protein